MFFIIYQAEIFAPENRPPVRFDKPDQFVRLCMGGGICPPRLTKTEASKVFTGITGAWPSRPPNSTESPAFLPGAGISLTAVVFLLMTPMAISSAMIADMVSGEVSPGMAIMSRPTEHTQVMASSFSRVRAPSEAALIMPASSLTGMKAPESPPT